MLVFGCQRLIWHRMCLYTCMRIAHDHKQVRLSGTSDVSDNTIKTILYWILVFLALICVISVGIIAIHWSINNRIF